jgi:hypothetical protein
MNFFIKHWMVCTWSWKDSQDMTMQTQRPEQWGINEKLKEN